MAVIQTIRNKAGMLVAIIIGMALVAFILGDMLSSGGQLLSKSQANVAVVNGKSISINKFQALVAEKEAMAKLQSNGAALNEQAILQIRQNAWDDMLHGMVMGREFDKLGLEVSNDELYDMINGENLHPVIVQNFSDPATGRVNRAVIAQVLQEINALPEGNTRKLIWLNLEEEIYKQRKTEKYINLISKGIYATDLEAKKRNTEMNESVNFSYIVKRYNEVPDSTIKVSDADVKAYYKEHKNEYEQKSSRDIKYVVWEVVPSAKDVKTAENWINEVKPEFASLDAKNTDQYISANSDAPSIPRNYSKGDLSPELDEFAFNTELGDVYGPYFEDNSYKLAKLSEINFLPDSVKASHILFQVDQNTIGGVKYFADSLVEQIKSGAADFASLAQQHSMDQSNAADGGDLGWFKEGVMALPFSDTCFYGKTGDVKLALTQFGLHIIKITGQSKATKKVKVGILSREVRISDETDQGYFAQASEFGSVNNTKEKFEAATNSGSVVALSALGIVTTQNQVNGLENSRSLVKWAFNNELGTVSKRVLEYDNKYVVAMVSNVKEEGIAPIESVRAAIEVEVRKKKQAEQLIAKINEAANGSSDLNSIAANLNTTPLSANNVKFSSYSIPNLGVEPKVQATAITLEEGATSEAIEGVNGVYVIQVDGKTAAAENIDVTFAKSMINRNYSTKANRSITVLNDLAEIEDNRISF